MKYTIEKLPDLPIIIASWGESHQFTPNDDRFVSQLNELLNQSGQGTTLIVDTTYFGMGTGGILDNLLAACFRSNAIPNNKNLQLMIFVSTNRQIYTFINRMKNKFSIPILVTQSLEQAWEKVSSQIESLH